MSTNDLIVKLIATSACSWVKLNDLTLSSNVFEKKIDEVVSNQPIEYLFFENYASSIQLPLRRPKVINFAMKSLA